MFPLLGISVVLGFLLLRPFTTASSAFGNGMHRRDKKLTGQMPLEEISVARELHCLLLCAGRDDCQAFNVGPVTAPRPTCQLFGEPACGSLDYQLEDTPSMLYSDVTRIASAGKERRSNFWDDPVCAEYGYCAVGCGAEAMGDPCRDDGHCRTGEMLPLEAYYCSTTTWTCQLSADFWAVQDERALPRWVELATDGTTLALGKQNYKQISGKRCELTFRVKPDGLGTPLSVGIHTQDDLENPRLYFTLGIQNNTVTVLKYRDETGEKNKEFSTANILSTDQFLLVNISWCDGSLKLVTASHSIQHSFAEYTGSAMKYVSVRSFDGIVGRFQISEGVTDSWRLQPYSPDPEYELGQDQVIWKRITPTAMLDITMDCKAESSCSIMFREQYAFQQQARAIFGGWDNTKKAIVMEFYNNTMHDLYTRTDHARLNSETVFKTFRVVYDNGLITAYALSESAHPIMSANMPQPFSAVNYVGVGGYGKPTVRLVRYDKSWRYSWNSHDTSFVNLHGLV